MRGEAAFMLLWVRVDWQVKHRARNHSERATAKSISRATGSMASSVRANS
jgi:hypothetical protein